MIRAQDIIMVMAREIDKEAWRYKTCKPGSDKDLRRDKSIEKAGRLWRAIAPMLKEKYFEVSIEQTFDLGARR